MSSDDTQLRLEAALQRILEGKPERIHAHRKLSVRAVEEEANLGNGSSYYYRDVVEKIKTAKATAQAIKTGRKPISGLEKAREAKQTAIRVKEQYRDEVKALRMEREQMAALHHQLSFALRMAHKRINELELKLNEAKLQLVDARRNNITALK